MCNSISMVIKKQKVTKVRALFLKLFIVVRVPKWEGLQVKIADEK